MREISTELEVERGVLHSIELCLNEITDNVLNHSIEMHDDRTPNGFLMAQIHCASKRVAISVFDTGIGIFENLRKAVPSIQNPREAIEAAMQKGVTSGNGKGNGLWILERVVLANGGSLEVSSGGARFSLVAATDNLAPITSFSKVRTVLPGTTLVDFQLDASKPISLTSALDYEPVDLWLESHENDSSSNSAVIRLVDESKGFGTRTAARQVRVLATNLAKEFDGQIILDFESVELVSTSYADELVAKLAQDNAIGNRLELRNVCDTCRLTITKALG